MKLSQKEIILKCLRDSGVWTEEYKLRAVDTRYGWLGISGDRRCRELAQDGKIERRHTGKYAEVRTLKETLF